MSKQFKRLTKAQAFDSPSLEINSPSEINSNPKDRKFSKSSTSSFNNIHNIIIPRVPGPKEDISTDLEERLMKSLRSIKKDKSLILIDFFGEGGQGIVSRMWDKKEKKFVAVKLSATNPIAAQNEQNCMKVIHESNRESLLKIYENESFKKSTFIKMECGVISILDYLDFFEAKNSKLSPNDCLFLCKSILHQARELKSLNMYNRDLKLENFIITEAGVIKVVDYDLSQISENSVAKDVIPVGTAMYWHPILAKAKQEMTTLKEFDLWQGELHTVYKSCQILLKNTKKSPEVQKLKKITPNEYFKIEEALDEIKIDQERVEVPDEMIAYTIRYRINEGYNLNPLRIVQIFDELNLKKDCLIWIKETYEYMRTRNLEFENFHFFFLDLAYLTLLESKQGIMENDEKFDKFNIIHNYKKNFEGKTNLEEFIKRSKPIIISNNQQNPLYIPTDRVIEPEPILDDTIDLENAQKLADLCLACSKAVYEDKDLEIQTKLIDDLANEFFIRNKQGIAKACLEISYILKLQDFAHSDFRIKDSYWAQAKCSTTLERAISLSFTGYEAMEAKANIELAAFNEFLGDIYQKFHDFSKSLFHYEKSCKILLNTPQTDELALIRSNLKLSALYKITKSIKESLAKCEEAMRLIAKSRCSPTFLHKYPDILADYFEHLRIPAEFLNHLSPQQEVSKILNNEENQKSEQECTICESSNSLSLDSDSPKIKRNITREDSIIVVC